MEDRRLSKCVMFGELVGSADCVGGQRKKWMGCFLDDLRAFGINADQWTTCSLRRGGMAQDGGIRVYRLYYARVELFSAILHGIWYAGSYYYL